MSDSLRPHGLYSPWNSPGHNTGLGGCSLLQGIFPPTGSNPGLSLCRQILYQLSHQGSSRIQEWVAYPFSRVTSQPRNQTEVLALQADFLPPELPGKMSQRRSVIAFGRIKKGKQSVTHSSSNISCHLPKYVHTYTYTHSTMSKIIHK